MYEKRILDYTKAICTKFIDEVDTGKAYSVETYNDCKQLLHMIKMYEGQLLSDSVLTEFLFDLFYNLLTDGTMPTNEQLELLRKELDKRFIIDGDFPY